MDSPGSVIEGVIAALLLGLSAGLFLAYSFSVMPGLRRVDDATFVTTMISINRAILNPVFFLVYVGAAVASIVAVVLAFVDGDVVGGWIWIVATALYLAGPIGVTGIVNVPLNSVLAADRDRAAFESRWVRFNHLRALLGTLAFVAALIALVA